MRPHHLKKTWITFTQGGIVPSLVDIGPVVLEKKMKMWKVYDSDDNNNDDNDDGQILIRKSHLSLRLRWAKNMESTFYMYITNNKLSRRSYCIFRYILRSLSRNSDSWCFYISNVIFQKLYSSCKLAGGLYKLNIYCKNTWETYILQWNVLILPVTPLLAQ